MPRPTRLPMLILVLFAAAIAGCTGASTAVSPSPADAKSEWRSDCVPLSLQTSVRSFDSRPAQRLTYIKDYKGNVALDDGIPDLETKNDSARMAHSAARVIDLYFAQLRRDGFGAWSGCYGSPEKQKPQMESVVGYYPGNGFRDFFQRKPFAGWQGDYVLYNRWFDISEEAVFHEWTHALVDNTIGLCGQDSAECHGSGEWGETGALYESAADVFAFVASGRFEMGVGDSKRSMANPSAFGGADDTAHYYRFQGQPACDERNHFCEKYKNAGIPDRAAHLMATGSAGVTPPIKPLGRQKVGKIYFHALNPKPGGYLTRNADFTSFATGVVNACDNLALDTTKTGISRDDCLQVKAAFTVVGMLPKYAMETAPVATAAPRPAAATIPPAPTARVLPTSTPTPSLLQRVPCKTVRGRLNVDNLTRWSVRMTDWICTGDPKYLIGYEDNVLEPGDEWSLGNFAYEPCTLKLVVEGKAALPLTLPVLAEGYCHQITIRESDFR